jgi:hypothetical protein
MMRAMTAVALVLALATGCATATLEDFKWTVEVPQTVDKGTEFHLNVKTVRLAAAGAEPAEPDVVEGVPYHYQIHWTGGTSAPLRHAAFTGEPIKIRARMAAGPATILITALNREGLDAKVSETKIEVK